MFLYNITTGEFSQDGAFEGSGYSGAGLTLVEGRNNPAMCAVQNKGPIPPGDYRIERPRDSATLGPCVFDLTPLPGTDTFGRSLFRIHGNNKDNNASHGCVILGPSIRYLLAHIITASIHANDNYNILRVVAA